MSLLYTASFKEFGSLVSNFEKHNLRSGHLTRPPLGGGLFRATPSRFLAISSKPMQVSPPNLQYPLSYHSYTLC